MFGVGGWDLIVLGVVAMVLIGPERLPKLAADAAQWVRRLRDLADRARADLSETVGPEAAGFVDDLRGLADLHPRNIIANALAEPRPTSAGGPAESARSASEGGPKSSGDADPTASRPAAFDPDAT